MGAGAPLGELLEAVWRLASPVARLEFTLSAVSARGADPSLASLLAQALEWARRLDEPARLPAWVESYPQLFVQMAEAFAGRADDPAADPLGEVARRVLEGTLFLTDDFLRTHGFEWVAPQVGETPPAGCSVAGEAVVDNVETGRISRVHQRGLRREGRLLQPALVSIQPAGQQAQGIASPVTGTVASPAQTGTPDAVLPDWARSLVTPPAPLEPAADRIVELLRIGGHGATVTAFELRWCLEPWLPYFTPSGLWRPGVPESWRERFQAVRPDLEEWLTSAFSLRVRTPGQGAAVESTWMTVVSDRASAHPHEWGTVARCESPAAIRGEEVIVPARVVRYTSGGDV